METRARETDSANKLPNELILQPCNFYISLVLKCSRDIFEQVKAIEHYFDYCYVRMAAPALLCAKGKYFLSGPFKKSFLLVHL